MTLPKPLWAPRAAFWITNPIIRGPIMIRDDNGEGNGWELVTSIDETSAPDFPVT